MDPDLLARVAPATQQQVLRWGDAERRDLPWRRTRDPWAVLVSETMLQQTQADRVVPRWTRFVERWPDVHHFASADLAEVLVEWSGLGYPRRARYLHLAARRMVERHDAAVPDSLAALMDLPGVGTYTARAVLAFAFEEDVAVVDTNVGRILARLVGSRLTPSAAQRVADSLVVTDQGWRWNQAMLDVGALHCRPAPSCSGCPFEHVCSWAVAGWPVPDPALRSAGVSRRQSRFDGSDRQARGVLLRSLEAAELPGDSVLAVLGWPDDEQHRRRSRKVVRSLVDDGLASWNRSDLLCLGGDFSHTTPHGR